MFYDAARDRFGARRGARVYEDLRQRNDPETSTTTSRRARHQTRVPVRRPRGMVRLEAGSFRTAGVELPDQDEASASVARPTEASNTLLVAGDRSANGRPIFVGGPQIGYNYPGLTLEMGLYGPSIRWRGSTSAPFPGYALIGRTDDFAWMITAADADIIDTYAERLCRGSRTRYVYKGRCRRMQRVNAGTIARGGEEVRARFLRTVHGPVVGYARVAGTNRRVALARKRSSYGRDATDLLFNQRITLRPREQRARLPARGRAGRRRRSTRCTRRTTRSRSTRPAGCRSGRAASTPTCRSTVAAGTSGAASCGRRDTRRTSTRRTGCSSAGTTSRRAASRRPTAAGTRAARSATTGCSRSSRAWTSTRPRPCSERRTPRRRPTRAA